MTFRKEPVMTHPRQDQLEHDALDARRIGAAAIVEKAQRGVGGALAVLAGNRRDVQAREPVDQRRGDRVLAAEGMQQPAVLLEALQAAVPAAGGGRPDHLDQRAQELGVVVHRQREFGLQRAAKIRQSFGRFGHGQISLFGRHIREIIRKVLVTGRGKRAE